MPRDRFLQIFWNLHLCDPSVTAKDPRNAKVQPLLDIHSSVFESAYTPGQHVAVDESMIGFKGRVSFRQYIRGKLHHFGIKAFVLVDSKTGYVHRLRIYFGADTDIIEDPNLLHTTRTVLTLAAPLEGKGYHLYTDCIYTSPDLALALYKKKIMMTGTVRINRRSMPLAVKASGKAKMKKGDVK